MLIHRIKNTGHSHRLPWDPGTEYLVAALLNAIQFHSTSANGALGGRNNAGIGDSGFVDLISRNT
jgi:hypothetical protein